MERNVKTYLDLLGMGNYLAVSMVSNILRTAIKDGVTKLVMTKEEFEQIEYFMISSAMWNWDRKTFIGMEFVVEN